MTIKVFMLKIMFSFKKTTKKRTLFLISSVSIVCLFYLGNVNVC
ncbi:hypothetical protein CDIMF43_180179 [Carnobacterium divergens]|nr:hypothetical protein CDIMF43_180179 [Carnobacterium divergens]